MDKWNSDICPKEKEVMFLKLKSAFKNTILKPSSFISNYTNIFYDLPDQVLKNALFVITKEVYPATTSDRETLYLSESSKIDTKNLISFSVPIILYVDNFSSSTPAIGLISLNSVNIFNNPFTISLDSVDEFLKKLYSDHENYCISAMVTKTDSVANVITKERIIMNDFNIKTFDIHSEFNVHITDDNSVAYFEVSFSSKVLSDGNQIRIRRSPFSINDMNMIPSYDTDVFELLMRLKTKIDHINSNYGNFTSIGNENTREGSIRSFLIPNKLIMEDEVPYDEVDLVSSVNLHKKLSFIKIEDESWNEIEENFLKKGYHVQNVFKNRMLVLKNRKEQVFLLPDYRGEDWNDYLYAIRERLEEGKYLRSLKVIEKIIIGGEK